MSEQEPNPQPANANIEVTPAEPTPNPTPQQQPQGPIVARAGAYYRNVRYLLTLAFLGWGLYSIYDGFIRYPRENAAAREVGQSEPHPGWDVPLNQAIGIALPPLALVFLFWTLRRSRGEFRLDGEVLHVPGHPPIHLDSIRKIDKRLWERKGIALIDYEVVAGENRTFKLDDFVYERKPIDQILERIEAHGRKLMQQLSPASAQDVAPASDEGGRQDGT